MYCRSAFFIGSVEPENMETFRSHMEGSVMDAMKQFPAIKGLRVKWARELEAGAPEILLTLEHCYDSKAELERALASDARARVWDALNVVMPYFQGEVRHVNSDVLDYGP